MMTMMPQRGGGEFADVIARLRGLLAPFRRQDGDGLAVGCMRPPGRTGGLFGAGWAKFKREREAAQASPAAWTATAPGAPPDIAGRVDAQSASATAAGAMRDRESNTDAAGLPFDPRVGQAAADSGVHPEHYLGLNSDGARVWAGAGQTSVDPKAPAALEGLVVTPGGEPVRQAAASDVVPQAALQTDVLARQREALKTILIDAEGRRDHVYRDSLKIPTVGIGHRVAPNDGLKLGDKIDDDRLDAFFEQDTQGALKAARRQAAAAGIDDPDFIAPLASVNFQLGPGWTKKFPNTWALIRKGDYAAAAVEVARSKWARQTPQRVAQFQSALHALASKPSP